MIATDEAGYGPKLGPLVVAATLWRLPDAEVRPECFEPLRRAGPSRPESDAGESDTGESDTGDSVTGDSERDNASPIGVSLDDSKRVYKSGDGVGRLLATTTMLARWCGGPDIVDVDALLRRLAIDRRAYRDIPWLANNTADPVPPPDHPPSHWTDAPIRLIDAAADVWPADRFNRRIEDGGNKSDLLGDATMGLVSKWVSNLDDDDDSAVTIWCDRLGGRKRYAGLIQHHFEDSIVSVIEETRSSSRYRIEPVPKMSAPPCDIEFVVGGDTRVPVAASSIVAKTIRQLMMMRLNAFFQRQHTDETTLVPTQGYPVDADRYLRDIASIRTRLGIADRDLIRCR